MNPSDAIEAIEKPLSSLPYSLSRHILEHLRKLTSHEPVNISTVLFITSP
jgi:predicted GTPase